MPNFHPKKKKNARRQNIESEKTEEASEPDLDMVDFGIIRPGI